MILLTSRLWTLFFHIQRGPGHQLMVKSWSDILARLLFNPESWLEVCFLPTSLETPAYWGREFQVLYDRGVLGVLCRNIEPVRFLWGTLCTTECLWRTGGRMDGSSLLSLQTLNSPEWGGGFHQNSMALQSLEIGLCGTRRKFWH